MTSCSARRSVTSVPPCASHCACASPRSTLDVRKGSVRCGDTGGHGGGGDGGGGVGGGVAGGVGASGNVGGASGGGAPGGARAAARRAPAAARSACRPGRRVARATRRKRPDQHDEAEQHDAPMQIPVPPAMPRRSPAGVVVVVRLRLVATSPSPLIRLTVRGSLRDARSPRGRRSAALERVGIVGTVVTVGTVAGIVVRRLAAPGAPRVGAGRHRKALGSGLFAREWDKRGPPGMAHGRSGARAVWLAETFDVMFLQCHSPCTPMRRGLRLRCLVRVGVCRVFLAVARRLAARDS